MSVLSLTRTIQVICDMRRFKADINTPAKMQEIWQQFSTGLVGKPIVPQSPLEIELPGGKITLWVVDARGVQRVEQDTAFEIVDILRNPTQFYRCKKCGAYGPLRCVRCMNEQCAEGQERLCAKCAYFIKDRLSAYCPSHIPLCQCSSSCKQHAEFACHHCSRPGDLKLFGAHYRQPHPQDPDREYCRRCYSLLFERCVVCTNQGQKRSLGKQRCAYRARISDEPCQAPLCWEHGLQWKVWGQYSRGLPFCPQHKQLLGRTDPATVLFIMISARPPRHSIRLSNIYRLRNVLNRDRVTPLTFEQLGTALRSLSKHTASWDEYAQKRYQEIMQAYQETIAIVPQQQNTLLQQIRAFYQRQAGQEITSLIAGLEIVDCFSKQQGLPTFSVYLYIRTNQVGRFIGKGSNLVQSIRDQLPIRHLEFWDVSSGRPISLKR